MKTNWYPKKHISIFYFLTFFAVFTGIFLTLTIFMIQIISTGTYANIDKALQEATHDTQFFVRRSLSFTAVAKERGYEEIPLTFRFGGELLANTEVLIYGANKSVLNTIDGLSTSLYLDFEESSLNSIVQKHVHNLSGKKESYRMITVSVQDDLFPEASYLSIAINTTQLEETNDRHIRIIIRLMLLFWILSIGASLYLAKWSRKPIVESYAKQQAFVENASHELRTPLSVLQNRLEILFRNPQTSIMDNSETIASCLEEVRNMRVLTSNLLNLARREDGILIEKKELSPDFFNAIFENYLLIAEEEGKEFYFINRLSRTVTSDPNLIKQVMTILFDNAMKYTSDDGVIKMSVDCLDKYIRLRISDNGFGIPDEEKDKIFDRFYRVDKAITRQKGGFGLGLSLAKQIINSLNGTIMVLDNQPKGTIFEVTIKMQNNLPSPMNIVEDFDTKL